MRIAVVNRFYPPDPAPTGLAAHTLLTALRARLPEAEFKVFTTGAAYRKQGSAAAEHDVEAVRLGSLPHGRGAMPRLLASLRDGRRLAARAASWADAVISLTDPPLLGWWMGRAAARHGRRWAEWTMDLFPEAFVAAGLTGAAHPAVRYIRAGLRRRPPERYICLGPRQHEYLQAQRGLRIPAFVLPTGRLGPPPQTAAPEWRRGEPRIALAYAGNLGEAHSAQVIAQLVRAADPARFVFLLAPHGARAPRLRRSLAQAPHVVWKDAADEADLAHADVHLATLRARWTHICVPSKAVSAAGYGRPLLFAGSPESDNWGMLAESAWLLPERPDGGYGDADVRAVLAAIAEPGERTRRAAATAAIRETLADTRDRAYDALADWLVTARPAVRTSPHAPARAGCRG